MKLLLFTGRDSTIHSFSIKGCKD